MWLRRSAAIVLFVLCASVTYYEPNGDGGRMSSTLRRYAIWESDGLVARLHPQPWTPGSVILERSAPGITGGSIFHLPEPEYLSWLLGARTVAELLCESLGVQRCALVSRPHRDRPAQIRVLPLHGLDAEWRPHLAGEEEHNAYDPGYCTSKTAPRWSSSSLTEIQTKIRAKLPSPDALPNLTFLGDDPAHLACSRALFAGRSSSGGCGRMKVMWPSSRLFPTPLASLCWSHGDL
ncbi:hypothetical protein Q5P01_025589 [Channa striata]|uniref:Uncharacterized protein n=1 Tax=Channa striata TaxID=64152 RepID=A0AA88IX29_CHASR|nr:hypothetical protein Q5P01_025589 [Channa striata]